jgi:formylmethanofuran dehydrogenase subunit E
MTDAEVRDRPIEERRDDLAKATAYHGHTCMGQVFGVLMAELGLQLVGTSNPKEILVIAENDRCIADALQILTRTRLGRRSFKLRDYGKMAATFINTKTQKASRVWVSGKMPFKGNFSTLSREEKDMALQAVLNSELSSILSYSEVTVELKDDELPGDLKVSVTCEQCKEKVMDNKHVTRDGKNLCRSCAEGAYYKKA